MERLIRLRRIELLRGEVACSRKTFGLGFFLDIERTNAGPLIYRCPIGDEFFVLPAVLQSHVRPEQAIDELVFLLLRADTG